MIKRILGIDHATRFGLALYVEEDSKEHVIETFTGTLNNTDNKDRFVEWYKILNDFFDLYKPNVICTEEPKHLRNAKVAQYLIGLYSITILVARLKGVTVIECNPKCVKKAVTDDGNASKEDVMFKLKEYYNLDYNDLCVDDYYKDKIRVKGTHYDKSDALALVHYYLNK